MEIDQEKGQKGKRLNRGIYAVVQVEAKLLGVGRLHPSVSTSQPVVR